MTHPAIQRYRDELADGVPRERALVRTMVTAGRTVVFSATTVALYVASPSSRRNPISPITAPGASSTNLSRPSLGVSRHTAALPAAIQWIARAGSPWRTTAWPSSWACRVQRRASAVASSLDSPQLPARSAASPASALASACGRRPATGIEESDIARY